MKYQIVIAHPHYDSYDGIRGWSYSRLDYAYQTKELALKLAEIIDEENAFVVRYGDDLFNGRQRSSEWTSSLTDDPYGDGVPF